MLDLDNGPWQAFPDTAVNLSELEVLIRPMDKHPSAENFNLYLDWTTSQGQILLLLYGLCRYYIRILWVLW